MLKKIKGPSFVVLCMAMVLVLIGVMILGINVGAVNLRPDWIFQIIVNHITGKEVFPVEWEAFMDGIVWGMRFPKVIVAACVGGGLSLVGIMMQAMTKNSLADPYILGISSGASTGATSVILLGSIPLIGASSVQMGAFLGAMASSLLVFVIAGSSGRFNSTTLVLSGTAVSAIFSAFTNVLIFLSPEKQKLNSAMFWMTGSFASAEWADVLPAVLALLVILVLTMVIHSSLDALLLGEEIAVTVGVNVKVLKIIIIISSSLVTGVMVSMSGVIGFVGLVIPHISRTLAGTVHRRLIPFSVLLGGIFMVLADMVARIVVAPSELPIGVVTALLGAPFFLFLIKKSRYSFSRR